MARKFQDMTGMVIGRLTVIERVFKEKSHDVLWKCRCECGNETVVTGSNLRRSTKSCGCLEAENRKLQCAKRVTHGDADSKLYCVWRTMIDRCVNENNSCYSRYGKRGITVCSEWLEDYKPFMDWSIANGYKEGLSIDRINTLKGYSPGNCRWETKFVQAINSRKRDGCASKFKGVTPRDGRWVVTVPCLGKQKRIGVFDTELAAALAYDDFMFETYKDKCFLNFPQRKIKNDRAEAASSTKQHAEAGSEASAQARELGTQSR